MEAGVELFSQVSRQPGATAWEDKALSIHL